MDNMSDEKKPSFILPEGNRVVIITSMEAKVSKSGNNMFEVIVEDCVTGDTQKIYLVNMPKKRWALKSVLVACGINADADFSWDDVIPQIIGKRMACNVQYYKKPWINRNGEEVMMEKANIKDFVEYTGNEVVKDSKGEPVELKDSIAWVE